MTNQEINDKVKRLKKLRAMTESDRDYQQRILQDKQDTLDAIDAEISALELTLQEQV